MKTVLLLLPLRSLSSRRNPWQKSLRVSQVLHRQCPHGQFLTLLLLLQSPQLLRPNPQHLCILPRAKGLHASLLPQELQLVPQLHQILQQDPLCGRQRPLLDEALAQVLTRSRSPSKCRLKKTKLMMKNLLKSSETGKSGPLEPRAQMCLCFWIQS